MIFLHLCSFGSHLLHLSLLTSSMALTQVREPPDVSQPHAEAHAGQEILDLVVPLGSVPSLLLLHPLQVFVAGNSVIHPGVWELQLHGGSKFCSESLMVWFCRCAAGPSSSLQTGAAALRGLPSSLSPLPGLCLLGRDCGIVTATCGPSAAAIGISLVPGYAAESAAWSGKGTTSLIMVLPLRRCCRLLSLKNTVKNSIQTYLRQLNLHFFLTFISKCFPTLYYKHG